MNCIFKFSGPLTDTLKSDVGLTATYQHLAKYIQTFLDQSAYGRVNFCDFFSPAASSVDIRPIKIESWTDASFLFFSSFTTVRVNPSCKVLFGFVYP